MDKRLGILIDEIDKAYLECPNDLLHELDRRGCTVMETGEEVAAQERPIVIITSNAEKELPDAFLRRCVFHSIDFPDAELMSRIVEVHEPGGNQQLLDQALAAFYSIRGMDRLRKKPSTSELVDWIAMLQAIELNEVSLSPDLPFLGTLLKKEQDLAAFLDATSGGGFRRRM